MVAIWKPDPTIMGRAMEPLGCTTSPKNLFKGVASMCNLSWLVLVFTNVSQKRMSIELLLSTCILHVV